MLPDQVLNPGPLTNESGALPIALRGPEAMVKMTLSSVNVCFYYPQFCLFYTI